MVRPLQGKRVLVTGGAGFLGSHFVRRALAAGVAALANLDLLTYAGDAARLAGVASDPRYQFLWGDVASPQTVAQAFASFRPDVVVHYAAESHVTRSESDPDRFFRTNLEGTRVLLQAAAISGVEVFVHVSTDEVYGPILTGAFTERDKPAGEGLATSPYARSKALADDLAHSYADRLPVVVARPTNAFGPWQFPEKVLPRWITRALRGEPLLLWGDGLYVRQWLAAEDFAVAIGVLAERGQPGQAYNVAPHHDPEITNLALARWLLAYLGLPEDRLHFSAYDRPDHDRRYAVDAAKIRALGWAPGACWEQLAATVDWYRASSSEGAGWWQAHVAEAESIYSDATHAPVPAPIPARA